MDLKEKQLLLADLCARLPYGVKVYNEPYTFDLDNFEFSSTISKTILEIIKEGWKPYLRPMSSMTEEERNEYFDFRSQELQRVAFAEVGREEAISEVMDWLLSHHFDIRGLIEKSLALEAPEGMYGI
jgi:hypothetical protein